MRVERDGWFIDIDVLDVSERPNWELRCAIRRQKEQREDERGHRFYVSHELSERLGLGEMNESEREELMSRAAKKVILREFDEIFSEPEGGLDSLRPLTHQDLS